MCLRVYVFMCLRVSMSMCLNPLVFLRARAPIFCSRPFRVQHLQVRECRHELSQTHARTCLFLRARVPFFSRPSRVPHLHACECRHKLTHTGLDILFLRARALRFFVRDRFAFIICRNANTDTNAHKHRPGHLFSARARGPPVFFFLCLSRPSRIQHLQERECAFFLFLY